LIPIASTLWRMRRSNPKKSGGPGRSFWRR
jgi:hypothetical protein